MRLLMLGDVIGKPGRTAVASFLRDRSELWDIIVINGENAAGGFGLTRATAIELLDAGADVITSGNHIWQHKEVLDYIDTDGVRVLRPANYPPGNQGRGYILIEKDGARILVVNLQGRQFMPMSLDCPFRTADTILRNTKADVVLVDFHAEATSEKQAMAFHLDGKATVVAGTHTHVLTADARIQARGTACITDLGMCGSRTGIIGMDPREARLRFLTGRPVRLKVDEGPLQVNGLDITLNDDHAVESIRTVNESV